MTEPSTNKSCPYSPHSGPVGCLPAPNIFPLAKETFAKGKMFWNFHLFVNLQGRIPDQLLSRLILSPPAKHCYSISPKIQVALLL